MYTFDFKKRVRYAETDKMSYLYYGNYPKYYEIGRVETLRSIGIAYKDLEDVHGVMLPVVRLEAKYLSPAYYDDHLTIRTHIKELPTKIISFYHEILSPTGDIINKATVKLFFVDTTSGKTVRAPQFLMDKIKPYFE